MRSRLAAARKRPPCIACTQGATAVETALARLAERADDPAWAGPITDAPFCLDDLIELWAVGAVARRRSSRSPAGSSTGSRPSAARLDGFAHHSSHDRRHLMTDDEKTAADEATGVLGRRPLSEAGIADEPLRTRRDPGSWGPGVFDRGWGREARSSDGGRGRCRLAARLEPARMPRRAEHREEVAVDAVVAGDLPGEDQADRRG